MIQKNKWKKLMRKNNNKKYIFLIRCFLAYLFFNTSLYASCNKEDVAYYLERGFNTDQVAALCGDETQNNKSEEEYQSYSDEYAETQDENYIKKMNLQFYMVQYDTTII